MEAARKQRMLYWPQVLGCCKPGEGIGGAARGTGGCQDSMASMESSFWLSSCPRHCLLPTQLLLVLDEIEGTLEHQAALLALVVQVARSNIPIVCKLLPLSIFALS